jgi:hypothetical protein
LIPCRETPFQHEEITIPRREIPFPLFEIAFPSHEIPFPLPEIAFPLRETASTFNGKTVSASNSHFLKKSVRKEELPKLQFHFKFKNFSCKYKYFVHLGGQNCSPLGIDRQ